jgi:DNA-binding response OmpR family regulator
MTMTSHQIEGYKAGADSYITKPFSMEVLDAGIDSLLSRSRKVNGDIKQKLMLKIRMLKLNLMMKSYCRRPSGLITNTYLILRST